MARFKRRKGRYGKRSFGKKRSRRAKRIGNYTVSRGGIRM